MEAKELFPVSYFVSDVRYNVITVWLQTEFCLTKSLCSCNNISIFAMSSFVYINGAFFLEIKTYFLSLFLPFLVYLAFQVLRLL